MYKVFISHSSKDKAFVKKLKEDLNFNEIETWLDEDELKVGDNLFDTLMIGIEESTHFLIVLSNNMQNSEWVQKELDEALRLLDKNILKKILPIVLRKTTIPDSLNALFRADFSNINFSITGDKVYSIGDAYHLELNKIINAIKHHSEYKLSNTEKTSIVKKTDMLSQPKKITTVIAFYKVAGYLTAENKKQTIRRVKLKAKNTPLNEIAVESVVPIILPNLLKQLFENLKYGDQILFPVDDKENLIGHFCGFSSNNTRMLVPLAIRNAFGIKSQDIVLVEIDGKNRSVRFID